MLFGALLAVVSVACASDADDLEDDPRAIAQAVSTTFAAREAATPETRRYSTAQAASDTAEEAYLELQSKSERLFGIYDRGALACGVHPRRPGLSMRNKDGAYEGFFIDLCHSVAFAILGRFRFDDSPIVEVVEVEPGDEDRALQDLEVDILATDIGWTLRRELEVGRATLPVLYVGQTFMLPVTARPRLLSEVDRGTVCVVEGSGAETNVQEWARANGAALELLRYSDLAEAALAYELGGCSALTASTTDLGAARLTFRDPDRHRLLADHFAERRAVLAMPIGDDRWHATVEYIVSGLIHAESLGITEDNVDDSMGSQNLQVRRLAGFEGDYGQEELNFDKSLFRNIIGEIGSFGEIYERNLGADGLGLFRGRNELVENGGGIWAPPLR